MIGHFSFSCLHCTAPILTSNTLSYIHQHRLSLRSFLRKELVKQVAETLHSTLNFPVIAKQQTSELIPRLDALADKMDGFKRSFEYIQDYALLYGLKIWQSEVSRIINFNVEQECNTFMSKKVFEWESQYQSRVVPIPRFPQTDASNNFVGRLANEILRLTNSETTVYLERTNTWYDAKTNKELLSSRVFSKIAAGTCSGHIWADCARPLPLLQDRQEAPDLPAVLHPAVDGEQTHPATPLRPRESD
eukprot:m.790920 g.790920  ORF g.790920 m.790920 type:complete len:247 (-) comp59208_c1_seq1:1175-1915(-)